MRLNRRNVLIGLGTIVAGGGAALGTGAFSSVEASRGVEINTTDDSNAYVTLTVANGAESYVDDSEDTILLDINRLNEESTTKIDELVVVDIDATDVTVTNIDIDVTGDSENVLTVLNPDPNAGEAFGLEINLEDNNAADLVDASIEITVEADPTTQ